MLIANKDKELHEQSPHIQTPTIKSKLISLNRFIDFVEERHLYIGLTPEQLKDLRKTSNSCKRNLRALREERTQKIKSFKTSVLISANKFQEYGCSKHVIAVCKLLQEIMTDPDTYLTFQEATDIRNYSMVTLCVINCLRALNLMNVTIYDYNQAKRDEEIKEAYRFHNDNYKTSLIYADKLILVSESLYNEINTYITYVRPMLIDDKFRSPKLRYIFTSSKDSSEKKELMNQMSHSLVSKCLSQSFEKSEVFLGKNGKRGEFPNVSHRGCFSVITEIIMLGEDSLNNIAHCFRKHSKETCKKFHVQFFSNREAARPSWKSLTMFTPINKEEEKVVKMC